MKRLALMSGLFLGLAWQVQGLPANGDARGFWVEFGEIELYLEGLEATRKLRFETPPESGEWTYVLITHGKPTQGRLRLERQGEAVELVAPPRGGPLSRVRWINSCLIRSEDSRTGAWTYWIRVQEEKLVDRDKAQLKSVWK